LPEPTGKGSHDGLDDERLSEHDAVLDLVLVEGAGRALRPCDG
jgi:hypothetical protein